MIYEKFKENPYYLGSVHAGDSEYEAGKAIGEWVVEQVFKKVIWASGGADMGVPMFVDRQEGFYDGIGDAEVEVIKVNGFPGDQFFADGSLSFLSAKNIKIFGLAAPMIANAVDGNSDVLKNDGLATNVAAPGWLVDNAEDCAKFISSSKRLYIYRR